MTKTLKVSVEIVGELKPNAGALIKCNSGNSNIVTIAPTLMDMLDRLESRIARIEDMLDSPREGK